MCSLKQSFSVDKVTVASIIYAYRRWQFWFQYLQFWVISLKRIWLLCYCLSLLKKIIFWCPVFLPYLGDFQKYTIVVWSSFKSGIFVLNASFKNFLQSNQHSLLCFPSWVRWYIIFLCFDIKPLILSWVRCVWGLVIIFSCLLYFFFYQDSDLVQYLLFKGCYCLLHFFPKECSWILILLWILNAASFVESSYCSI